MNAKITYRVGRIYHPFNKARANELVWCLIKVTKPELGESKEEAVALFNLDSEARTFQGHVYADGLDGQLVSIDRDVRELYEFYKEETRG